MVTNQSKQQSNAPKKTGLRISGIILLVVLGVSFFLAQSATWLNNTLFDQKTFTTIGTEVILEQSNRDAIAKSIVDGALADRPIADRIIGDRAVGFVSNLLGSDLSERALDRTINGLYAYLTSPDRADIAIELTVIRDPLSQLIAFAESSGRDVQLDPEAIPERIVLVDEEELPDIASYIHMSVLAASVLWILTIGSFIGYVFQQRQNRARRIYIASAVIAAVAVLALFTGPFIPPAVASFVSNIDLRGVVSSLTAAYIAPFTSQLYLTFVVVGLLVIITHYRAALSGAGRSAYHSIRARTRSK